MLALGHAGDALAIGASVVFSVVFGFITDFRAERALDALRTLSAPTARVVRGGLEREIPADDLRPGDLVVLTGGQIVAADGRITAARDLQADESALTGESLPVAKSPEPCGCRVPAAGPDLDGLRRHDARRRMGAHGRDGHRVRHGAGPHREARRRPGTARRRRSRNRPNSSAGGSRSSPSGSPRS